MTLAQLYILVTLLNKHFAFNTKPDGHFKQEMDSS